MLPSRPFSLFELGVPARGTRDEGSYGARIDSAANPEDVAFSPSKRVHEERLARPRRTPDGYQIEWLWLHFPEHGGGLTRQGYAFGASRAIAGRRSG